MKDRIKSFFLNPVTIVVVYVAITIVVSLLQYLAGEKEFNGLPYTHYNNYIIFKQSFIHLLNNDNLYQAWPQEHWDFYKYSPTFPVLFSPFLLLPDLAGLVIWNLLNSMILFFAIKGINGFSFQSKIIMLWFVLPELVVSLQNSQSNGLMAGLIIAAFNNTENKKFLIASILISLSAFIKIFGVLAFVFFIFQKEKFKAAASAIFCMLVFTALPLIICTLPELKLQYQNWFDLLKADQEASTGLSVLGWLKSWFFIEPDKNYVTLAGIVFFCLPLIRISSYKLYQYRLLFLASVLIWVIIFNHRAESPTFIIAISGAAIWYFSRKRLLPDLILLIVAFVFASLSPTDIFPKIIREQVVIPYVLKAVPLIFIWLKIVLEQLSITDSDYKARLSV